MMIETNRAINGRLAETWAAAMHGEAISGGRPARSFMDTLEILTSRLTRTNLAGINKYARGQFVLSGL